MLITLTNALLQQRLHFLLGIPQPAGAGRISRHRTVALRLRNPLALPRLDLLQHRNRLLGRQRIRDVSEINTPHDLLGAHLCDDPPNRFAQRLRPQIPQSVDDGPEREMHHAFLRADPSQLAVRDEVPPCLAPVAGQGVQRLAHYQRGQQRDGLADDFVAAANGEGLGS